MRFLLFDFGYIIIVGKRRSVGVRSGKVVMVGVRCSLFSLLVVHGCSCAGGGEGVGLDVSRPDGDVYR